MMSLIYREHTMTTLERQELVTYMTALGKHSVKFFISVEGPWSAVDIERMYELIGHGLRIGAFDKTLPKESAHDNA